MKKLCAVILALALLCSLAAAAADEEQWICPGCGKATSGNFCSWCGTQKPARKAACPSCGAEYDADAGFAFCSSCGASLTAPVKAADIAKGDVITFGRYEQDNKAGNGPEPIEWIVLDVKGTKALLLSKYVLTGRMYHEKGEDVEWKNCTIRAWLNNEFLNDAFSPQEQKAIRITHVDNSHGMGESFMRNSFSSGAQDTDDRVFLLSYHEAYDMYFVNNESRTCNATDYAIEKGTSTSTKYNIETEELITTAIWYLRSPGCQDIAAEVAYDGTEGGCSVVCIQGIRPALWVELNDIF